jgi:predicted nicotinamide N-methyase
MTLSLEEGGPSPPVLQQPAPVLMIHDKYPIYLKEDWSSGIGGGLWTTGLAMAHYIMTNHCWMQLQRRQHRRQQQLRVLELGSGNGFLSVCLIVAIKSHLERQQQQRRRQKHDIDIDNHIDDNIQLKVVVTDTAEHLSLMRQTINNNLKRCGCLLVGDNNDDEDGKDVYCGITPFQKQPVVSVQEYLWGESTNQLFDAIHDNNYSDDKNNKNNTVSDEQDERFDLIIGSDLAYRDDLHDPLIDAFHQLTTSTEPATTILLGVTMLDTKPIFFHKLHNAGFRYERLADHLIESQFRGQQFGIFVIWKGLS